MSVQERKGTTLVTGATGKTGHRVVERLVAGGHAVRAGSRAGDPPFDWERPATWDTALAGIDAVYLVYYPDLAAPGALAAVRAFLGRAVRHGVRRVVLLSGRGEPEAEQCEDAVRGCGLDWTIVRASWFNQNFTEGYLREPIVDGEVVLPAGDVPEPFIDADDIADVAVAALTQDGHAGELYEVTGPRALTFEQAVGEIAAITDREIRYVRMPLADYTRDLARVGVPDTFIGLLSYLFSTVLDGRNAQPTDGVQRALGRPPRDFADFVRAADAAGIWQPESQAMR